MLPTETNTPTKGQARALREARRLDRHEMCLTTSRSHPRAVVDACVAAGWLSELPEPVVVCDGEGFTIQPERWRTGYVLTDAGRAVVEEP
jgi:hypothetical protein